MMKQDDYDRTVAMMAATLMASGRWSLGQAGHDSINLAAACGLTRDEAKPAVRGVPVEVVQRILDAENSMENVCVCCDIDAATVERLHLALDAARAAIAAAKEVE